MTFLTYFKMRCNFSLVARYSLKFNRCLLLVAKSLVTRCRSCSLQKFTRYSLQKLLVAKNHSLLVAKFARYSLQKLLVAKNHSLLVAKFARYSLQKLLVAKIYSLLVAKFARYSLQKFIRCKKSVVARCKIQSLLIDKLTKKSQLNLVMGGKI